MFQQLLQKGIHVPEAVAQDSKDTAQNNRLTAAEGRLDTIETNITAIQGLFDSNVMCINHLDLVSGETFTFVDGPGGPPIPPKLVKISYREDITSPPNSGFEYVHLALQVPPGFTVKDVRICYKLSNVRSFISGTKT